MKNLTTNDLFGRIFLRCSDLRPIDGYFACLNSIRPLLENHEFKSSTPGFYVNISEGINSVRLSYFTNNKTETERVIQKFLKQNTSIGLFKQEDPHATKVSERYSGEELRFRNFLHTYTQIGLDLLEYDILYSRRLLAEYRLTYSPQKISCGPLFEPAFTKHSLFFNQLYSSSVKQLWKDLNYWHPISNKKYVADWAHFLVNMLLPGDWIYIKDPRTGKLLFGDLFLRPTPKLPIAGVQKIQMLRMFNLDIPDNWSPNN